MGRNTRTPLRTLLGALCLSFTVQCVGPQRTYSLTASPLAAGAVGSVQLERIERNQLLVLVELDALPPPERIESGLTEFVVWLEDEHGRRVNAGTLRYDRAHGAA